MWKVQRRRLVGVVVVVVGRRANEWIDGEEEEEGKQCDLFIHQQFGHKHQWKIVQKYTKFAKVGSK